MCVHLMDHVRVPKQKRRKGQAGVATQFSLGHRWCGGLNVRLRLWGYVEEEGFLGMSVHTYVCVCVSGGGELFVNAWRMCVLFKSKKVEKGTNRERK